MNVSNNEVREISGIYIYYPSISSISFSSFRNNKATGSNGWICILCSYNTHQMTNTNIIANNQQSTSYGIIYTTNSAKLTMKH